MQISCLRSWLEPYVFAIKPGPSTLLSTPSEECIYWGPKLLWTRYTHFTHFILGVSFLLDMSDWKILCGGYSTISYFLLWRQPCCNWAPFSPSSTRGLQCASLKTVYKNSKKHQKFQINGSRNPSWKQTITTGSFFCLWWVSCHVFQKCETVKLFICMKSSHIKLFSMWSDLHFYSPTGRAPIATPTGWRSDWAKPRERNNVQLPVQL